MISLLPDVTPCLDNPGLHSHCTYTIHCTHHLHFSIACPLIMHHATRLRESHYTIFPPSKHSLRHSRANFSYQHGSHRAPPARSNQI
ncbi:hypothetical protein AG1IA_07221 [Rhizoctonia solani AG-1 IA]|uniref:Uncharacterized protein n=1 Tax=Thanatephorus cucumeris (strain AG1-IA) TaxID=983506 RepID=L8WKN3_THACA|nr:hypothetical protein AG1IA_07221 [Rhizoctonia solani AG-1 IA]